MEDGVTERCRYAAQRIIRAAFGVIGPMPAYLVLLVLLALLRSHSGPSRTSSAVKLFGKSLSLGVFSLVSFQMLGHRGWPMQGVLVDLFPPFRRCGCAGHDGMRLPSCRGVSPLRSALIVRVEEAM